jgi:hypothetical protein
MTTIENGPYIIETSNNGIGDIYIKLYDCRVSSETPIFYWTERDGCMINDAFEIEPQTRNFKKIMLMVNELMEEEIV